MQRNLNIFDETKYALEHYPHIVVMNTIFWGVLGAFWGAVMTDVRNFPAKYEINQFIKNQAGSYNCYVSGDLHLGDLQLKCDSEHSKKALGLAAKVYGYTLPNLQYTSGYTIIANSMVIGAICGFYLGVRKAKEIRLSNNSNTLYYRQEDAPASSHHTNAPRKHM